MKKELLQPHQHVTFAARPYGYVVQIRKQLWQQPVAFVAQDLLNNDRIAAGSVEPHTYMNEFLVYPNIPFTVKNVGEWPLVIKWP